MPPESGPRTGRQDTMSSSDHADTAAGSVCALGDCGRPAGPGGVLCPEDKERLEATLFTRGRRTATDQARQAGPGAEAGP
jgi:hypothetical protein